MSRYKLIIYLLCGIVFFEFLIISELMPSWFRSITTSTRKINKKITIHKGSLFYGIDIKVEQYATIKGVSMSTGIVSDLNIVGEMTPAGYSFHHAAWIHEKGRVSAFFFVIP